MKGIYSIIPLFMFLTSVNVQAQSIYGTWKSNLQLVNDYTYNVRQSLRISSNYIEQSVQCSVEGNAGSATVRADSSMQVQAQADGKTFYLYNINFQGERKEFRLHIFYGPTMYCYIGGAQNAVMSVILLDENTLRVINYDGSSTLFKRD